MMAIAFWWTSVIAAATSSDPISAQTDRAQSAYRKCVEAAALRMSKSPETATVVSKASLTACLPARDAFADSLVRDILKSRPDISQVSTEKSVSRFMTGVDRTMRDYAAYVVTNARSGK